ncbi:MAG TPA: NADH:flavin oxidoreductase/NADH oxidase [Bauldia sp.]|nr:NADH:flavin oxidoreductase/NADH oxidase [Bauldia sp.]
MTAQLFAPIALGGLDLPNRIAVAPMCQYSADDGSATDWHLQHWMSLAMSGAGMVTIEATAVTRQGRITHGCLGLYSDDNEAAAHRTLAAARRVAQPGTRFGIQLAHAGRKASTNRPWQGGGPLVHHEDPWQTVGPSAAPYAHDWHVPQALDDAGIEHTIAAFATAARRAVRAGFDFVELHLAHGYLVHQFLSPLANKRTDQWGGPLENRMRLALAIAAAVKAAVPAGFPVGARMSVTDWVDGGFNPDEAVVVARALKQAGIVYVCCSSGGVDPGQKVPTGPSYQVHLAERIRRDAGIPTRAVGLIDDPHVAEQILHDGKADLVALARAILADPRWPWRAAAALGAHMHHVPQYQRSVFLIEKWAKPPARSSAA